MIENYFEHGNETLSTYDLIICTEKGEIAFVNQKKSLIYIMKCNGIDLIQYCNDNNNQWTDKIMWMTHDYFLIYSEKMEEIL